MTQPTDARRSAGWFRRLIPLVGLIAILLLGGYLRFRGLEVRSLWRDELCTWHVSRMELGESLRWGPELTKPPLYQFLLRAMTSDPHPSEWTLRFPASLCGLLTILAVFWLGRVGAGSRVGLAAAALIACNVLQIEYAQEARPYTILVLGCTLSTVLWYQMVVGARRSTALAYTLVTALTLYANYLAILTVLAQFLWWLMAVPVRSNRADAPRESDVGTETIESERAGTQTASDTGSRGGVPPSPSREPPAYRPLLVMAVTGVLCLPLAIRYLAYKSSMFQGLEWIKPPTWSSSLDVLGRLTYGRQWVFGLLLTSAVVWLVAAARFARRRRLDGKGRLLFSGRTDVCGLLLIWVACTWFGLVVVSWVAHPAMVARYALPASVPAILLPLILADRWRRWAPLGVAAVFVLAALSTGLAREINPGFRELAAYLQEHIDRDTEMVVLTIDDTIYPGWEDSERLEFQYYPLHDVPLTVLHLDPDGVTARNDTLKDPRGLYLVVLWADPFAVIRMAGRQSIDIVYRGQSYSQLLFEPYRLVRVAAVSENGGSGH